MSTILEVLVNGLSFGAVYALVALGLALVYKATRILNFAQGEFGTVPAWIGYVIMTGFQIDGEPTIHRGRLWLATLVAIVVGAGLGVLINTLVVRRLASVSPVTSLVATAGVMTFLISVQVIVFEAKGRRFPRYIEGGFRMPGADINVAWQNVLIIIVLAGAAALLALLFRTPPGVALLATAQDPFAAELQGISVANMRTLAWATAGALGAVAGMLGAGVFGSTFSPGLMTSTFLIPAFIGAVLGGIASMVGAVAGGLLLGVTVAAANQTGAHVRTRHPGPAPPRGVRRAASRADACGPPDSSGRRRSGRRHRRTRSRGAGPGRRARAHASRGRRGRIVAAVAGRHRGAARRCWPACVLLILAIPQMVPAIYTNVVARAAIYGIVALSLNVIVGYTGQVSLGHNAFVGVGAFGAGYALTEMQLPYGAALVVAALTGVVGALLIGAIALRLAGLYLALVTIAYAFFGQEVLFNIRSLTGGGAGQPAPRPSMFSDRCRLRLPLHRGALASRWRSTGG